MGKQASDSCTSYTATSTSWLSIGNDEFHLKAGEEESSTPGFSGPQAKSIPAGDDRKGGSGLGWLAEPQAVKQPRAEASRGREGRGEAGTSGVCVVGMGSSGLPG